MTTPENTALPPTLNPGDRFKSEPLTGSVNLVSALEGLLKFPGRLLYELRAGRALAAAISLGALLLLCLVIYGLVVGSLTNGQQLWIAPVKMLIGSLLSALICLPSLYIFLCLGGADTTLKKVGGELLAAVTLTSLLLIGFAPVAWVFSQSTDSVALMAALHLCFWFIALGFGLRLLGRGPDPATRSDTKVWILIYVFVCLQMMTSLRPIIGSSATFLPDKKEFFLNHAWRVMISGASKANFPQDS